MNMLTGLRSAALPSLGRRFLSSALLLPLLGCAGADPSTESENVQASQQGVTLDPVGVCNQDPRVNLGLVPLAICAGARVFFDEKFNGNGRACGTCHPAANNYTIDPKFIATLPSTDPLFVGDNPIFAGTLETADLRSPLASVRENVDGFEHVEYKFVGRAVSHTLSLATSITRDPADNTSAAFSQRVGWGGDGAPGDGSLRSFLDGAIKQHYTTDKNRTPGTSFRVPSDAERDQVLAFQLALGRTNELNLSQVTLSDAGAATGKTAFMDPLQGRCNECHSNAGANALASGKNRNFNTGTLLAPGTFSTLPDGRLLFDGGFGGQNKAEPDLTLANPAGVQFGVAFGDGSFSVPPLIEAADTGPFFHSHNVGQASDPAQGLEQAVAFYGSNTFLLSPAAKELNGRFNGAEVKVGPVIQPIARFLRVLNAAFNLAIAKQRLDASRSLNIAYWAYRDDVQKGLLRLASEEIDDAVRVLQAASDLHVAQQTGLQSAMALIAQGVATSDPSVRKARTESALTLVQSAKAALGTNMNFSLGAGNLMF